MLRTFNAGSILPIYRPENQVQLKVNTDALIYTSDPISPFKHIYSEQLTAINEEEKSLKEGRQNPSLLRKRILSCSSSFRDGKKSSMYHSGYTCGFFPSRKSNINSTSTFSLRVGFAGLP
jgi:hypothetical protein